MGDTLTGLTGSIDPLGGAFNLGAGITRPGVSQLTARLSNVGGISSSIAKRKNRLSVTSSPERKALIDDVSNLLKENAGELSDIREQVRPGFSDFRRAGLEAIGTRARRSIGNLRENLARRRIQGSSFAEDTITRAEREFAQEESEFAAATTLQELDVFTQLTQQITTQQVAAVERQIQELNLQLDVGLQLAGAATQSLTAASIQQQQNAAAFTQQALSLAGAGIGACVIAREVYGQNNPQWMLFRHWLFHEAPVWLFRWYLRNQYKVADKISERPFVKRMVRKAMDWVIDG